MADPTLTEQARAIANALYKTPCTNRDDKDRSCIVAERERKLSKTERDRFTHVAHATKRPITLADPQRMCASCAAYWHAENLAIVLENARRIGAPIEDTIKAGV